MIIKNVKLLSTNNVLFDKGLTISEISEIQKIYDISFPESLQSFLMAALPISASFYNWRNKENTNVKYIKSMMNQPVKYIENMPEVIYWCDQWGKEPKSKEEFNAEVRNRLRRAPALIPVFSHRYMPSIKEKDPPIISIHGGDIIYMGENLEDYLEVEFGNKKQGEINFSRIKPIPFWSDLI